MSIEEKSAMTSLKAAAVTLKGGGGTLPASERVPARSRVRWRALVSASVLVVVALALVVPAFQYNALGAADGKLFPVWQVDSEALVYAKIESTTPQARADGIDALGLLVAQREQLAPVMTFDRLVRGEVPTTTRYLPYQSQIGLPGYLFTALYHLGITSSAGLHLVAAVLFVLVLGLFVLLLRRITTTGFAAVTAVAVVASPWMTVAGRNLYWVPWTWFLPACAAAWYCSSTGRRRSLALVALVAAFLLRWASGYEFLTSITLLAAAMPPLAVLLGRTTGRSMRRALRDSLVVIGVALAAFAVSLVVLAFLTGAGNPMRGAGIIAYDIGKRTYGGVETDNALLAASFAANPFDVLATYFFGWTTNVLSIVPGTPFQVVLGAASFWPMVVAGVVVVLVRRFWRDPLWRRDLWLIAIALVVPLSWLVPAKAHAYVHPYIDFVVFYLVTVSAFLWVIGAFAVPTLRDLLLRSGAAVVRAARVEA